MCRYNNIEVRHSQCIMISLWFILSWALASAGRNAGGRTNVGEWTDTTWTDNPFMARLDVHKDDYSFICGGSIIATNEWNGKGVILTAAHCVYGADNVNIWVGCTDTMCSDRIATGFNDDHYMVHPDYTEDLSTTDVRWCNNDVALVFLRKAITVEVLKNGVHRLHRYCHRNGVHRIDGVRVHK